MIFVKIEVRFLLGISLGIADNTIQSASNWRLVNLLMLPVRIFLLNGSLINCQQSQNGLW